MPAEANITATKPTPQLDRPGVSPPTVKLSHARLALGPERARSLRPPATSEIVPTPFTRLSEPVRMKTSAVPSAALWLTVIMPVV